MTAPLMDSQVPRWYVIQTKPKQERRAEDNLRRWGIETLAPKLREPKAWGRKNHPKSTATPLFPGYLFARFTVEALFAKIIYTRGVQRVIGFGECATPVDDDIIELIRRRIHEDGFVHPPEPRVGETIHVVESPLGAIEGVFERELRGHERVLILLTTVRSQIRIQLPKTCIRAAAGFTAA